LSISIHARLHESKQFLFLFQRQGISSRFDLGECAHKIKLALLEQTDERNYPFKQKETKRAKTSFSYGEREPSLSSFPFVKKDCFGEPPKPTREPRVLPRHPGDPRHPWSPLFSEIGVRSCPFVVSASILIGLDRERVGPTRRSVSRSGGYRVENRY